MILKNPNKVFEQTYNPEFINRIDETNVFFPLTKKEISQIVDIQLNDLQSRLVDRNIKLLITKETKEYVVDLGFDPMLGARPLRRAVQRFIEDPLAEEFLLDKFHDGDSINTFENNKVNFSKVEEVKSETKAEEPKTGKTDV